MHKATGGGLMAKKGKIRKGFTTYLLVLFIALIAAFMIFVTVMLFSPFKNILGFKYFLYQSEDYVYNVTGGSEGEIFDFSKIQEIKIDCNYANVHVERYDNLDSNAIIIKNNTKGFARETQNTDFKYTLTYENSAKTILNVTVQEPEGFLYLSKDLTITVAIPIHSSYALANTKIDITNTSGHIYIGNNTKITTVGSNEINLNSLSVKTNSGEFIMFPLIESGFDDIFIKSAKGDVSIRTDLIANAFELHSTAGDVKMQDIICSQSNMVLDIDNSKFTANTIVSNIDLSIKKGILNAEEIIGNVVANDSNEQMKSATINIGKVNGAVSIPFANASRITIEELANASECYIHATSGDITIGKTYGYVDIETASGDIDLHTFATDFKVKSTSGTIDVKFDNSTIKNQLDISSTKGKVNLAVKNDLAFVLAVYNCDGESRTDGVKIDFLGGKFTNPYTINGGTKIVKIITNAKVDVTLI